MSMYLKRSACWDSRILYEIRLSYREKRLSYRHLRQIITFFINVYIFLERYYYYVSTNSDFILVIIVFFNVVGSVLERPIMGPRNSDGLRLLDALSN